MQLKTVKTACLLCSALFLVGCSEPSTAIRVRIDASDEVSSSLSTLYLAALTEDGFLLWEHQWEAPIDFPANLTFTMGEHREIQFVAQALDSQGVLIDEDTFLTRFIDGQVNWIDLTLDECTECSADGDADIDADADGDADEDDTDVDIDEEVDADPDYDFDLETMYVNPGCDEAVDKIGIDAAWTQLEAGIEFLHVTQWTRRWALNLSTNEWVEEMATSDMALDWTVNTEPDTAVNPGQDPTVQANGIDAAFTISNGTTDIYLIVIAETMFWTYSIETGAWIGASGFVPMRGLFHEFLDLQGITGGVCAASGFETTNPGEDSAVIAHGIRTISRYSGDAFRLGDATRMWYGAYNPSTLALNFSCLYQPHAQAFEQSGDPNCTSDPEGVINPGCHSSVRDRGINSSYFTRGDGYFHVTQANRHWAFSSSERVWIEGEYTDDIAAKFREFLPGCDAVVVE